MGFFGRVKGVWEKVEKKILDFIGFLCVFFKILVVVYIKVLLHSYFTK
jgi:hypothetical protein